MLQASGRTSSSRLCYCSAVTHLHRWISRRVWPENNRCLCDENTTTTLVVIWTSWPCIQEKCYPLLTSGRKHDVIPLPTKYLVTKDPNNIMKFGCNTMKPTFQSIKIPSAGLSLAPAPVGSPVPKLWPKPWPVEPWSSSPQQGLRYRSRFGGRSIRESRQPAGFLMIFGDVSPNCFGTVSDLLLFERTLRSLKINEINVGWVAKMIGFLNIHPLLFESSRVHDQVEWWDSNRNGSASGQTPPERRTVPWPSMTHSTEPDLDRAEGFLSQPTGLFAANCIHSRPISQQPHLSFAPNSLKRHHEAWQKCWDLRVPKSLGWRVSKIFFLWF